MSAPASPASSALSKKIGKPNDALSLAAAKAKLGASDLDCVKAWLGEQFLANMYAKLGQGGDAEGEIALRRVFVDLPATASATANAAAGERFNFLQYFLASAPIKLARIDQALQLDDALDSRAQDMVDGLDENAPVGKTRRKSAKEARATLLIGGPGQGKSTLGQLACQLHRAALLSPFAATLSTRHREMLATFYPAPPEPDSQTADLPPPAKPLLPLQIALPELASWLATHTAAPHGADAVSHPPRPMPAILRFLAQRPSAQSCKLTADTLLAIGAHMPILLVLDGFDEVGAGKDRERLVAAARELLTVLAAQQSSVQILATTRPQGYAGELAQLGVRLIEIVLAPLARDEALYYAQKLFAAKIHGADERQAMLERLKEAADEPATQRLLTTPLQVTILSSLVQQSGRPPRERWNLFSKYFSYTYNREIVHNTYASKLLSDHRQHIEQIHARVALLLQVEAERDGGAAARMTRARLEDVIDKVLLEDGVADDERIGLVRQISVAAEQRLVFLVEPEPGCFGFEIRSLQEFMAAWALTSGREKELEERLHTLAKAPMFRNVTLFIASRFFSEGAALRDVFAESICPSLDHDAQDPLVRHTRAGSLLALEILEEGAALSQPKRARALMACACGLLALPPGSEHIRLVNIANKDIYPVLQDALEQCLAKADQGFEQQTAWFCLLVVVGNCAEGAMALAERYWPQLAEPASLLQQWKRFHIPLDPWFSAKIEQHAAQFSPEDFIGLRASGDNNWVACMSRLFRGGGAVARSRGFLYELLGQSDLSVTAPRTAAPGCWQPWVLAARFMLVPSAGSLAVALDGIADGLPIDKWSSLQDNSTWPLAVCLAGANSPEDLRGFAQQARAGVLGDAPEWLAAEQTWMRGFNLYAVWESSKVLWTGESLKRHPPTLALSGSHIAVQSHANKIDFLKRIDQTLRAASAPSLQEWLLNAYSWLLRFEKINEVKSDSYVKQWLMDFKSAKIFLLPRPAFLSHQAWLSALSANEELKLANGIFFFSATLLHALIEAKGHPKVLRLFIQEIHRLRNSLELSRVSNIPKTFWRQNKGDASADWRMLQLYGGMIASEQDDALLDTMASATMDNPVIWDEFFAILAVAPLPPPRLAALLAKAYAHPAHTGVKNTAAKYCIDLMRKQLETRQSDLSKHTTWNRLALPLPYPLQSPTSAQETALPSNPVWIASLELKNIRALHHLKLDFPAPAKNHGQWVVILGQNGVGKTTLLRSIALGLRNVKNPIWPTEAFSSSWLRIGDAKEKEIGEAEILLTLGSGESLGTVIRQNDKTISMHQGPEQDNRLFPLFAYGCRRGSALAGGKREVKLDDIGGPEIATLFDDDADLIHAETWLMILEGAAQKDAPSKTVFVSLMAALKRFLNVAAVEVKVDGVWVTEHTGLELPFKTLSDGYLTSAGWFLDLIARWLALAKQDQQVINADFMEQMRGLVLIDEIDLHLHPRWQIDIIDRTRKLLPQMSFIVTTHNPLTLVGAKAQEIWILAPENGRIQAQIQDGTPMLLTGGQIYRRYFGIEDIYPKRLGKALQRYSFLTGFALRTDAEQAELAALQKELADAEIKPDWDIVPREIPPSDLADMTDMTDMIGITPASGHSANAAAAPTTAKPRAKRAKAAK